MPLGLSVALVMLAETPAQAAPTPAAQTTPPGPPAKSDPIKVTPADRCPAPNSNSNVIVICTERTDGYRLNRDVMEAKREMKSGGRPTSPYGVPRSDCATVGPAPCASAGISLIGVALTAAEMAKRVAEGKEVGSMFKTDPHPSEYQLYQMAKERREAEEAEKAALAKAKAAGAAQPAPAAASAPQKPSN
jgi:hypothetical protein